MTPPANANNVSMLNILADEQHQHAKCQQPTTIRDELNLPCA
jgi:hypothetical protein